VIPLLSVSDSSGLRIIDTLAETRSRKNPQAIQTEERSWQQIGEPDPEFSTTLMS